jgi:hypothetical protein
MKLGLTKELHKSKHLPTGISWTTVYFLLKIKDWGGEGGGGVGGKGGGGGREEKWTKPCMHIWIIKEKGKKKPKKKESIQNKKD